MTIHDSIHYIQDVLGLSFTKNRLEREQDGTTYRLHFILNEDGNDFMLDMQIGNSEASSLSVAITLGDMLANDWVVI